MATLLHGAVTDLNYTQPTWRWLKLYNISVVPSHLRSAAPKVNVRRSRILLRIDGAEYSSRGVKSEQTIVGIHFTGRWAKHTGAGRVSAPHTELLLCSLKPRASEERSIISCFLCLGMRALSHIKGSGLMCRVRMQFSHRVF